MKKAIAFLSILFLADVHAQIITTVAGNGTPGFSGDGGQATAAELNYPYRTTFDASGNMYIADNANNLIRKVDISGVITTAAGTGAQTFCGDGGPATSACFYTPTGVTFDAAGNMYITDEDNFRIRKVNASGTILTVAGNGNGGFSGDGGAGTAAELLRPYETVVDAAGNLYIADTENNRIRKVDASSGIITTIAGNGTAAYSGDGGAATAASLNNPSGLVLDPSTGNIYIADSYNNCIRKIIVSTGIITTVAGNGTPGFSGDGGQATVATIHSPRGVAFAGGNLYIADESNNRIRKVNAAGIMSTVVGNGTAGFSGDGGFAINAELYHPVGVNFDTHGNLYISEFENHRIRKVNQIEFGVNELTSNTALVKLYPNPCNSYVTIESGLKEKTTVSVLDMNGKVVLVEVIDNGIGYINTGNLNAGIYTVSIVGNENTFNKKMAIVK